MSLSLFSLSGETASEDGDSFPELLLPFSSLVLFSEPLDLPDRDAPESSTSEESVAFVANSMTSGFTLLSAYIFCHKSSKLISVLSELEKY